MLDEGCREQAITLIYISRFPRCADHTLQISFLLLNIPQYCNNRLVWARRAHKIATFPVSDRKHGMCV